MTDIKSNMRSATEDEVGSLHKGITRILSKQQAALLSQIEEAESEGEVLAALALVDDKLLRAHMRWVEQNRIGYAPSESAEADGFRSRMSEIREKAKQKTAHLRAVNADD